MKEADRISAEPPYAASYRSASCRCCIYTLEAPSTQCPVCCFEKISRCCCFKSQGPSREAKSRQVTIFWFRTARQVTESTPLGDTSNPDERSLFCCHSCVLPRSTGVVLQTAGRRVRSVHVKTQILTRLTCPSVPVYNTSTDFPVHAGLQCRGRLICRSRH